MNRFVTRPGFCKRLLPERLVRTKVDSGILLTFDDGPRRETTPRVLDFLAEVGVKAIFFLVGHRVQNAPELVERIVREGHTPGNHTESHDRVSLANPWRVARDFALAEERIFQAAGVRPRLWRPPLGRVTPALLAAAWHAQATLMNWSLDSGDWRCRSDADADQVSQELRAALRPSDIVLLHDDHLFLPRILERLRPQLTTVSLSHSQQNRYSVECTH